MSKHKKTQAVVALVALLSFTSAAMPCAAQAEAPSAEATANPNEGVFPDDPRPTYVLQAVLCWNEASDNEHDCRAIGNIRRRYAQSNGITLREALLRLHSERRAHSPETASLRSDRATNPRAGDARPWLGDVREDLHQPRGWTGTAAEWERTAAKFRRLFAISQELERGLVRDTCVAAPIGWGGPSVDAEGLAELARRGRELVHCSGTANFYYRRASRQPQQ